MSFEKKMTNAAQEQAVRLAGEVDRLHDVLKKAHVRCDALERLRDELIGINDLINVEKNEWVSKAVARDNQIVELQTEIGKALALVNSDCPAMDPFTNLIPTVKWLLQKWCECRNRGHSFAEESMKNTTLEIPELHIRLRAHLDTLTINSNTIGGIRASLLLPFACEWNGLVRDETAKREQCVPDAPIDDDGDYRAKMNDPRITAESGLNPSDTPRTDAVTIECGWDTTHPVVRKTFAQDLERECAYRERNRREIQKEWERCHDAWRNSQVRIEALLVALKETNTLLTSDPQAWTQAKTDQMRRNSELIGDTPLKK